MSPLAQTRRLIAHADLDAFYAAAEQLDDPTLRGRPVLIGGRSGRGVVLTCSYEARRHGVHSAMPMSRALRLCPDAVCVPPRFERYTALSKAMMQAFATFSPRVEPLSLDEAFIDLTGTEHLFGPPAQVGSSIKEAVYAATGGLTVSVGICSTKFVAKVASAYDKPDGLTIVEHGEARDWLAPQPVKRLWGAGPKMCERLRALGIDTVGQLAAADVHWLRHRLGRAGGHLRQLAQGIDPRPVTRWAGRKSVGSDRTLAQDVDAIEDIERHLRSSADAIGQRLRKKNLRARGVRVRLKTASFKLESRQAQLSTPTHVAAELYAMARELLRRFDHREPYRLVGMAAFDLTEELPYQLDWYATLAAETAGSAGRGPNHMLRLETALDKVKARFGKGAIARAETLMHGPAEQRAPDLDLLSETAE